jgi:hypothetical protein
MQILSPTCVISKAESITLFRDRQLWSTLHARRHPLPIPPNEARESLTKTEQVKFASVELTKL